MIRPQTKGNDMTNFNNEVRELAIDEVDAVSGGWPMTRTPGYPIASAVATAYGIGAEVASMYGFRPWMD
jgi:hypothetical protein